MGTLSKPATLEHPRRPGTRFVTPMSHRGPVSERELIDAIADYNDLRFNRRTRRNAKRILRKASKAGY